MPAPPLRRCVPSPRAPSERRRAPPRRGLHAAAGRGSAAWAPPGSPEARAPGGGGQEKLRPLKFRRRDGQRVLLQKRAAGTDTVMKTFLVAEIVSAGACRVALRGMLETLPQLRSLHLAQDEWDAVVPEDVVPEIVRAACRSDGKGFTFCIRMSMRQWVIHDERAFLIARKERPPGEQNDCAICFASVRTAVLRLSLDRRPP